jgi:DNA replication protein DnaC
MKIITINEDTQEQQVHTASQQWQEAVYDRMHSMTRRVEPLNRGESCYMGKTESGKDIYAIGE